MKKTNLLLFFYFLFALCHAQQGDLEALEKKLNQTQEDTNRAKALDDLAWEYSFLDYTKSNTYCRKEIVLSRKINYTSGEANACSIMGNNFRGLGQFDSAHYYLSQALLIRKDQKNKERVAATIINIANIYFSEKKYTKAILTYNEGIKLAHEAKHKKYVLVAFNSLANLYRDLGLYNKAIQAMDTAIRINKTLKDSHEEPYLYTTMAGLLHKMNNLRAALAYERKVLKLLETQHNVALETTVFNNMANNYSNLGLFDSAYAFYMRALEAERQIGDTEGMGTTNISLAAMFQDQKKFKESLVYCERAMTVAKTLNDTVIGYKASVLMSEAYMELKDYDRALALALETKALIEPRNAIDDLHSVHLTLANIYKHLGMYRESVACFEKVFLYADSLFTEKNAESSAALNVQFDVYDKEKEIELLNKDFELKEAELSKQKVARQLSSWIAGLVILIGLVLLFFNRRIKKARAIIQELKEKEQENKVLKAQMNPHFIFNSLNSIQQFILSDDNETARFYLSKFSRLMRRLLESNINDFISLSEEIDLCEKYLEIESLRFNNAFHYTISIKNGLDATRIHIPHSLIQAFLENAIWHGLLPKQGPKELSVLFEKTSERMLICLITDNGIGRVNAEKNKSMPDEKKSLAIGFIRQRLQLYSKIYGNDYGLDIIDKYTPAEESAGTQVVLRIPIINP